MAISQKEELTNEQKATNDLKSAMDSVNLVNKLVSANTYTAENASEQVLNTIDRNYRHCSIVLKREWVIANTTEDLTPFNNAVTTGKNYIVAANTASNANVANIKID